MDDATWSMDHKTYSMDHTTILRAQDQLEMKNSHFADLPYRSCRADSVQGCQEIMLLIRAKPFEEHNKITQRWIRKQGGDVNSLVFSTRLLRISFDLLYGFTTWTNARIFVCRLHCSWACCVEAIVNTITVAKIKIVILQANLSGRSVNDRTEQSSESRWCMGVGSRFFDTFYSRQPATRCCCNC